ncbi:unnamed protein product [Brachionus calyciflorus]|uniref:UPAR/Ly6 domain-containing protein n=1 Tax=Brachionus calyciflorus TaxID=104777 RepID=A0A814HVW8_9BILA|nr:unnamed protein product [Brachionus calyciflorus]
MQFKISVGIECFVCEICPGSTVKAIYIETPKLVDSCNFCRTMYLDKTDDKSLIITKSCVQNCVEANSGGVRETCCNKDKCDKNESSRIEKNFKTSIFINLLLFFLLLA